MKSESAGYDEYAKKQGKRIKELNKTFPPGPPAPPVPQVGLPTDRDERNKIQIWDGYVMYFPDVIPAVAAVSVAGNKQYGFGGKLRWEREISTDHMNKVFRHMLDHAAGRVKDTDGTYHLAKAIWRLSAELQLQIERDVVDLDHLDL